MADIFQVEHEILAPADRRVHPKGVLFHDGPAVELVPQHAVVEVGGIFHHVGSVFLPGHQPVLINVSLLGDPLPHDPVKVGDHQVAGAAFRCTHQASGGIRCDPVVAVQKLEIGSPGPVQGKISAGGNAGVLLMENLNTAVLGRIFVADRAGIVRAAVIHQQQFKIRIFLVQNTFNASPDGLLCIIDRDNDTDGGIHRLAPLEKISIDYLYLSVVSQFSRK